jgi:hypothetical protein
VAAATDLAGRVTAEAAAATGLLAGTPVVVGAGDVPASQVGAGALAWLLRLLGQTATPNYAEVDRLLAGGAHPFAELLTDSYPLERVAEPLAQAAGLAEPDDRLLKAVVRP